MEPLTTIRLQMFEVYEKANPNFPLFVSSDSFDARQVMEEGDTMVQRWWVREGGA